MLKAELTVVYGNVDERVTMKCSVSPLQAVEVVANKYGFFDVDLVNNDIGSYRIVAKAHSRTLTANGKTIGEAVEKLLNLFSEGTVI